MPKKMVHINFNRLKNDLLTLAEMGKAEDQGIYRMAFTQAELEARSWIKNRMEQAHLRFSQDGAGNIFGKIDPKNSKPKVLIGSHMDTVPAGGFLDGVLGVLVGLECLRRIKEENIQTVFPIELVIFSDEEGRFGGMLGSEAFVGDLDNDKINQAVDLNGIRLVDAMRECGLDAKNILSASRSADQVQAYLELHIEQGPILDQMNLSIGIIESIVGLRKWKVRLTGRADHAGTTPMNMRRDAFLGLTDFSSSIPQVLDKAGEKTSVATIGKVDLFPGTANTVPGQVEFSLDFRDPNEEILDSLAKNFHETLKEISKNKNLTMELESLSEIAPAKCKSKIIKLIQSAAIEHDFKFHKMISGAAHDAQFVSKIAPIGMIFVPSKEGRSHSSSEWTNWEDIEKGANLTLTSLIKIANEN